MVEGAVRPLEARTDHSDLGMPLEDGDDGVERSRQSRPYPD